MIRRTAEYQRAITFIAQKVGEGAPWALLPEQVQTMKTVLCIAETFAVPADRVAKDVVYFRRNGSHLVKAVP